MKVSKGLDSTMKLPICALNFESPFVCFCFETLCSPYWPGTLFEDQAELEFTEILLRLPPRMLGIKDFATTHAHTHTPITDQIQGESNFGKGALLTQHTHMEPRWRPRSGTGVRSLELECAAGTGFTEPGSVCGPREHFRGGKGHDDHN